ncbi:glycosyltransferase [Agaribacterium sp. ZY112]|uniref:glycosyltransferase n=1 Tax=Agaribacterium sp. ZY112 TaxID=3233574 RepID=UPI0035254475
MSDLGLQRIDLFAPPFRGHLHPILAMGRELKAAGYSVCVFSTASAQADIESSGLEAFIFSGIDDSALLRVVNPSGQIGRSPRKLKQQFEAVLVFFRLLNDELQSIYQDRHVDLIIADFTLAPVVLYANKHHLRCWTSLPSPCVLECKDGPPAYFGGLQPKKGKHYQLYYYLARKLVQLFKQSLFYLNRKTIKQMGLESVYREDGSERIYSHEKILCLADPRLEFATQWPKAAEFIGPQLYSPNTAVESLQNLTAPSFIQGKRHVLVTLGTHLDWHKQALWQALQSVCPHFDDVVFHFSNGGAELNKPRSTERCMRYQYINYKQHINSYDLVLHHGGAGIMYHCLQAGIPAIIYPVDYDQFDHAARLAFYGYGLWLKDLKNLKAVLEEALKKESVSQPALHLSSLPTLLELIQKVKGEPESP